jgi:hypothetical protein
MLTVRKVVGGFLSVWSDTLPLLTPSAVSALNGHLELPGEFAAAVSPVVTEADPGIQDYISEMAFQAAAAAGGDLDQLLGSLEGDRFDRIARTVAERLRGLSRLNLAPEMLGVEERKEISGLAENLLGFVRCHQALAGPLFFPRIPGHGVLAECAGDIGLGDTLVEIKAVTRSLRSRDVRQVFVYLALDAAQGRERWTRVEFFNPKRALLASFTVEQLWAELSGGKPHLQLYADFLDHFETRDFQPPSSG